MKIAILISGQPRSWELCKWFHKNSIMNYNDCDVFLSIDRNNNTQLLYENNTDELHTDIVQKIIGFYKPTRYFISSEKDEKQLDLDCDSITNSNCILYNYDNAVNDIELNNYLINQDTAYLSELRPLKINNTLYKGNDIVNGLIIKEHYYGFVRQYYFLHKVYELLMSHINNTGTKYDIIIRLRFDHILWNDDFAKKELLTFENNNESSNDIKYTYNNIKFAETLTYEKKINIDIPEINTINVLGGGIYKNYTYVNDYFWTHGEDLLNKMITFYPELINITNDAIVNGYPQYGATIEHFFSVFLSKQQLIIKKTLMNKGTIVRTK